MLYPLKFKPVYKENVWGGNKLKEHYNRNIPSAHTGESWDVACHNHGMSVVADGMLAGKTLQELFDTYGTELLGPKFDDYEKFPLLVKLIDAKDRLSLQVHPDNLYANLLEQGEYGKCEMWYVLRAEPGAKLTIGLKDGVSKQDFIQGLLDKELERCINQVEVQAGDVFNIPAGLIHAIGEGIMVAEVQQNSDTVYRVYDWNRMGLDGKPRELHVAKALGSIDFEHKISKDKVKGLTISQKDVDRTYLIANEYFAIENLKLKGKVIEDTDNRKMFILMCLSGGMDLRYKDTIYHIDRGETMLVPAALGSFEIAGSAEILKAYIPDVQTDLVEPLLAKGISMEEIESKVSLK